MRILLVEDNPDHAALVTRCLGRIGQGHTLHHVTDGQAALDYVQERVARASDEAPDLIFLDLNLPKVSGFEVLAALKGTPELQAIPVVVLTTSDAESDRTVAYSLFANSYLVKSNEYGAFQEMLQVVERYWRRWGGGAGLQDTDNRNGGRS